MVSALRNDPRKICQICQFILPSPKLTETLRITSILGESSSYVSWVTCHLRGWLEVQSPSGRIYYWNQLLGRTVIGRISMLSDLDIYIYIYIYIYILCVYIYIYKCIIFLS